MWDWSCNLSEMSLKSDICPRLYYGNESVDQHNYIFLNTYTIKCKFYIWMRISRRTTNVTNITEVLVALNRVSEGQDVWWFQNPTPPHTHAYLQLLYLHPVAPYTVSNDWNRVDDWSQKSSKNHVSKDRTLSVKWGLCPSVDIIRLKLYVFRKISA